MFLYYNSAQAKEPSQNWGAIRNSKDCLYKENYNPME